MSVALSPLFNGWQGFTSGGLPLNGGLINTYIAGGVTTQATFTTSVGNVQNSNPIVLGADGRPPNEVWLTQGVSYRFDLTDSTGSLIKTYDNISSINDQTTLLAYEAAVAASTGSSLVGFLQSGTGAVARTLQSKERDVVSVFDFMTAAQIADVQNGTGVPTLDVTSALQAAYDSAPDSSGGTQGAGGFEVWHPYGVYGIATGPLKIGKSAHGKRMILSGSTGMIGATGTILKNVTSSNVDIIDASSIVIDTFSMYGLVLWGNGKGTGTGRGVVLGDNAFSTKCLFDSQISRCWFTNIPDACIAGENITDYQIFDNGIENSAVGVRIKNSTVSGGNDSGNRIYDNTIYGCGIGVHQIAGGSFGGNDNRITDNIFWFCGTNPGGVGDDTHAAIVMDMNGSPAIRDSVISNNTFRACVNDIFLLGHNGSYAAGTGVNAISVIGNHSDRGYRRFIQINGANNIRVIGNTIDSCGVEANNTYDAIQITGTSDSCFVDGNSNTIIAGLSCRYGLFLDSATTNTTVGVNDFTGASGNENFAAGATLSNRGVMKGTWTPILFGGTTAGTNTYAVQSGTWARIGGLVHLQGVIVLSAFDAATVGVMQIKIPPFLCAENANFTLGAYGGVTMPANTVLALRMNPATAFISLISSNIAGGVLAALDKATIGAGFSIYFSAVYMAQ